MDAMLNIVKIVKVPLLFLLAYFLIVSVVLFFVLFFIPRSSDTVALDESKPFAYAQCTQSIESEGDVMDHPIRDAYWKNNNLIVQAVIPTSCSFQSAQGYTSVSGSTVNLYFDGSGGGPTACICYIRTQYVVPNIVQRNLAIILSTPSGYTIDSMVLNPTTQ